MPSEKRFLFVLGTGRCGSTMVQEVLARHDATGFISNVEDRTSAMAFLNRWNGPIYRRLPPSVTTKGRVRYAPSEAYRILDREVSPIMSAPARDLVAQDALPWLSARVRTFFEERANAQRSHVFLHKFTGWPRARFLGAIFPEARFIHVVRDGRAVANSWLQMDWWLGFGGPQRWQWGELPPEYARRWEESQRSYPMLAGMLWQMLIDAHEASAAELDHRWLTVRYEDVVADPRGRFGEMLEFAGLPMDAAFRRALDRQPFSAGRTDAFRRDLGEDVVRRLTAALAPHLERYGYPA